MEEWKDIIGVEEHYQVSNKGRVKNKHTGNILKPSCNSGGYEHVELRYGYNKDELVHRLVAKMFLPNPNNFNQVNHKDENKRNNDVLNLEWCNAKYNTNYGIGSLQRNQRIIQFDLNGNALKIWESMKDACISLGLKYQGISACCRDKKKTCGGYVWTYANIYCIRKRWNKQ